MAEDVLYKGRKCSVGSRLKSLARNLFSTLHGISSPTSPPEHPDIYSSSASTRYHIFESIDCEASQADARTYSRSNDQEAVWVRRGFRLGFHPGFLPQGWSSGSIRAHRSMHMGDKQMA
jgi:hypothetical protein